jgi:hypothetical protein
MRKVRDDPGVSDLWGDSGLLIGARLRDRLDGRARAEDGAQPPGQSPACADDRERLVAVLRFCGLSEWRLALVRKVLAPSLKLSLEGALDVLARVLSPLADLPRAPANAISQTLGPQPTIVRGAAELLLNTAPAHPGPVDDLFQEAQHFLR